MWEVTFHLLVLVVCLFGSLYELRAPRSSRRRCTSFIEIYPPSLYIPLLKGPGVALVFSGQKAHLTFSYRNATWSYTNVAMAPCRIPHFNLLLQALEDQQWSPESLRHNPHLWFCVLSSLCLPEMFKNLPQHSPFLSKRIPLMLSIPPSLLK